MGNVLRDARARRTAALADLALNPPVPRRYPTPSLADPVREWARLGRALRRLARRRYIWANLGTLLGALRARGRVADAPGAGGEPDEFELVDD